MKLLIDEDVFDNNSGDESDENVPLIDIASTSKATKRNNKKGNKGDKKKKRKTVDKYEDTIRQQQPPLAGMSSEMWR